jgi:N-acetylglutamate synthase-like GNAT family acetyltransferase
MHSYNLIDYEDRYQSVFKSMNAEWLEQYNLMEPHDLEILDNPRKTILEPGGFIWLAQCDGVIVGSAALIKEHDGIYELAKMSVAKDHRQKGLSKRLLERCIERAKAVNAQKIILFSNHQLEAALGLYEKYGFQHVPVVDSPFLTADVRMELVL